MTIARGNVLFGSTTSPAMHGASSRPAKPKQRLAKKSTVGSAAKFGRNDAGGIGVAEPEWKSATSPTTRRAPEGSHWERPPMFWTHLPVFSPTMLNASAIPSRTSEAPAAYVWLCSSAAKRVPKT